MPQAYDFDRIIDRRETHCAKWDGMEGLYGVTPQDGLAMWVADMDFAAPPEVVAALRALVDHEVYGYFGDGQAYLNAITGWMKTRHGWTVDPEWISTTHGLVSAIGLALRAYSDPGDGIILFTPVYHAFAKMIKANGREVVESPLSLKERQYHMDLEALAASLTGRERMVIFCSPHNPGGRIWTVEEQSALAAFCEAHDLILVCDEVHHDLVFPGETHTVMPLAAPQVLDRLVMLTASSKTFNLAGAMTGNAIIANPKLRAAFDAEHMAAGKSPNIFGMATATAAYTHGTRWLEALMQYLDGNRQVFDAGLNAIPGVEVMPMQATYLSWVNFANTGMDPQEVTSRIQNDAKIAANHGPTFGAGGETFMRFNLATPRARVADAVARLQSAFSDLQ